MYFNCYFYLFEGTKPGTPVVEQSFSASKDDKIVTEQFTSMARKPFEQLSNDDQISFVLEWIMGKQNYAEILNGKQLIKNIKIHLDKMKYNGYLRLLDIDLGMVKDLM